jgi:hypothetical protein
LDYYPDDHVWDVVTINNHEHLSEIADSE